jgi:hypothetical protein
LYYNNTSRPRITAAIIAAVMIVGSSTILPLSYAKTSSSSSPSSASSSSTNATSPKSSLNSSPTSPSSSSPQSSAPGHAGSLPATGGTPPGQLKGGGGTCQSSRCAVQPSTDLAVQKFCFVQAPEQRQGPCPRSFRFQITVTGNNPQPSTFTIASGDEKSVSLGHGTYTITEQTPEIPDNSVLLFVTFHGDCNKSGPFTATGTIAAGESQNCIIQNQYKPAP